MKKTPIELMAYAIEISRKATSDPGRRPFAALVVRDGEIVGEGLNDSPSTHDPTAHGEVLAIRDATRRLGTDDLSGCEIYTTCEPCSLCVAAIWWTRLERMYYAATLADCTDIGIGVTGLVDRVSLPVGKRDIPEIRLLGPESRAVLEDWLASPGYQRF